LQGFFGTALRLEPDVLGATCLAMVEKRIEDEIEGAHGGQRDGSRKKAEECAGMLRDAAQSGWL
jgi:hypothetical protein